MKKKKSQKDYRYDLVDVMDILEDGKSGWAKAIIKVVWDENPMTIDIRNINLDNINEDNDKIKFGSGISLSEDTCFRLAKVLLDYGYLSLEDIEEYLNNRDSIFKKKGKKKIKVKVRRRD